MTDATVEKPKRKRVVGPRKKKTKGGWLAALFALSVVLGLANTLLFWKLIGRLM